jgi:hypothetical protein
MPASRISSSRGAQLVGVRADAGEVRHRLDAQLGLDALGDVDRAVARRAAGT